MVGYNLVELSDRNTSINDPDSKIKIIDVWKHNLDTEMHKIIHMVEKYPCIAMVCNGELLLIYYYNNSLSIFAVIVYYTSLNN